jgi:hypothetical protein
MPAQIKMIPRAKEATPNAITYGRSRPSSSEAPYPVTTLDANNGAKETTQSPLIGSEREPGRLVLVSNHNEWAFDAPARDGDASSLWRCPSLTRPDTE